MLAEFLTLVFVAPGLLKIKEFLENVKQIKARGCGYIIIINEQKFANMICYVTSKLINQSNVSKQTYK